LACTWHDEQLVRLDNTIFWTLPQAAGRWFRVVVHRTVNDDGKMVLQFEHPTLAGTAHGGWMEVMLNF